MADTLVQPITPERQALLLALAQQAAAWWREKIQGPGYLSKFDNGDRSRAGETMQVMASLAALRGPQPKAEQCERFEQVLVERIQAILLEEPFPVRTLSAWVQEGLAKQYTPEELAEQEALSVASPARNLVLSVDYSPEGLLGDVVDETRVSGLPWKTTMWVNWDARPEHCYVDVRAGSGRAIERLPAVGEGATT